MTPDEFYQALENKGFPLTCQQKRQFEDYFTLLIEWNQKLNLTAITQKKEVYLKHFFDSLAPVLQGIITDQSSRLLDVGAGAGFPSFPIKILCPTLTLTVIDALNKRIHFLKHVIEQLGIGNVWLYHGRAEDFAREVAFRNQFDQVVARAIAPLPVLCELTIPYVKVGGQLIALKAAKSQEEKKQAQHAFEVLFTQVVKENEYELPNGDKRTVLVLEKQNDTPSLYPRKAGVPSKRPL